MITFQSASLALLFYTVALILNSIELSYDEQLEIVQLNGTLNAGNHEAFYSTTTAAYLSSSASIFMPLLLSKAVVVTLAWILLALKPSTNLLVKHLREVEHETTN